MNPHHEPMLAYSMEVPFSSKDWIFKIKCGGIRAISYVNGELAIKSRNNKEVKYNFPDQELKRPLNNAVLDGEIVAIREGKPDFQTLIARAHYDLLLDRQGLLKSWAVTKGIPEQSSQKRLAVDSEDHPIEYANFEGTIPKGQHGAGRVDLWDKGTYDLKVWNEDKIEFILKGQRLKAGTYWLNSRNLLKKIGFS